MHTVTKMADLTKFCQTEWSFMDLTILDFDECWPFLLLHAFLDISDKVMKMANLTKFCETEWMFTDLTILANFSQTRKSEIRLSKVTIFDEFGQISHTESAWRMTILTNFGQIRHTEISLANDDFDEIFADFVTACISGHISILQASKIGRSYFQLCKDFNPQL